MTSSLRDNLQGIDALFRDLGDERSLARGVVRHSAQPGVGPSRLFDGVGAGEIPRAAGRQGQANPAIWSKTAILVTTDEGGGYYDSGYIQILDFFGDGTRIPLIAISPFAKRGYVDHTYYDHASVLKFIERNWRLHAACRIAAATTFPIRK